MLIISACGSSAQVQDLSKTKDLSQVPKPQILDYHPLNYQRDWEMSSEAANFGDSFKAGLTFNVVSGTPQGELKVIQIAKDVPDKCMLEVAYIKEMKGSEPVYDGPALYVKIEHHPEIAEYNGIFLTLLMPESAKSFYGIRVRFISEDRKSRYSQVASFKDFVAVGGRRV